MNHFVSTVMAKRVQILMSSLNWAWARAFELRNVDVIDWAYS